MASPQTQRVSSNGELELTELEVNSESGGQGRYIADVFLINGRRRVVCTFLFTPAGREEDPWEDYQDYKKVEVEETAPTTSAKGKPNRWTLLTRTIYSSVY